MTQRISVTRRVRRPVHAVAALITDMHALVPALSTFERFAFIDDTDGGQLWDVFLESGTIYLGGRVLATTDGSSLTWRSLRGTRHTFEIATRQDGDGSVITLAMTFTLAGIGTAFFTEFIGRGIVSRTLEAAAEQIRHHLEFDQDASTRQNRSTMSDTRGSPRDRAQ